MNKREKAKVARKTYEKPDVPKPCIECKSRDWDWINSNAVCGLTGRSVDRFGTCAVWEARG